jgi:hypothetical protein
MTRVLLTFISIFFLTIPLFAQSLSVDTAWVRRYNGPANGYDGANDMAVDSYGNVFVTGYSEGSGTNYDYLTIKYYSNGATAWEGRYNGLGSNDDRAGALVVDDSGFVYVTGWSDQVSGAQVNYDYTTIKYKPNGDTAWVRKYNGTGNGDDFAYGIAIDDSGNVYVTGESKGSGTDNDYATIKYNRNGGVVWEKRYDGPINAKDFPSTFHPIAVDYLHNVYVCGVSSGGATDYDYATIKYHQDGDTAWVRRYNGPRDSADFALGIAVDDSGYVYVTGGSTGIGTNLDYLTVKYRSNGDTLWTRRYYCNADGQDVGLSIAVDKSGNIYVTGQSYDTTTGYGLDFATIKYYSGGDTAWVRRYSRPPNCGDNAFDLAIDNKGNTYATGYTKCTGDPPRWDYATIKYDSIGNLLWDKIYDGPASDSDKAYAIALDDKGSVYVTGGSFGVGSYYDYLTIKYVQFLRGDANSDKKVTIADIVFLVSYLFKHGPAPVPIQSGDANCDGNVTIADIVYLVAYLFKHGPVPCI